MQHSKDGQLYFGITKDLNRRVSEHNKKRQSATRRNNGQWQLVYAEAYRAKQDATQREKMLKHHGSAKRKLVDRISNSLLAN